MSSLTPDIPFQPDQWVTDRPNPAKPGQYTGKWRMAGPQVMVQLKYPDGGTSYRPLSALETMSRNREETESLSERLAAGRFGKARDLQRLVTFEKLKGTLHEVIYSMEAAQIDFYPYQFKPVLKFINSPTERLIIADEVGLGKTIESALIWMELQARQQAKRMLVVCSRIIAEKWREELRSKFLLDARIVDFRGLQQEVEELKRIGDGHSFVLIATYSGLRAPLDEIRLLKEPPGNDTDGSVKTRFLRELRHWGLGFSPFDLVVFDEAHYMRKSSTATFHMGAALAREAGAVLCVTATPVCNGNLDLHSLLRLVDESFFDQPGIFEDLLIANRPAVVAGNALSQMPVNVGLLSQALKAMGSSRYIKDSPLFQQLKRFVSNLDCDNRPSVAKCQDLAEKLNLLGSYINRTRRVHVAENRPIRDPMVRPIEYSPEEAMLYKSILNLVRRRCQLDNRPIHVFQVLGLQLRAASCLPVIASEIRSGRFGDPCELFQESFSGETFDSFFEENATDEALQGEDFQELIETDFEKIDSKYAELKMLLTEIVPDEKVVLFAFYRPTLAYLLRRLRADGVDVTTIHGGIDNDSRWRELERFKDPRGPRVLLSSEVGSEGIDLQFCRVLVNYDLPWNPMRIEQRIGRIDRVGQEAKRLSIVNFKIKDTVEERLYDRLHSKLERFANSLGDLEAVIGKEVQTLTVELLSKDLTPEMEEQMIEASERVIENRLLELQALEESGEALVALSDYVQRRISEDRDKGRYIQPQEIEDYLFDFFQREFPGSEFLPNTPVEGCVTLRLSVGAQASLAQFIKDDRTLSARPLRQREIALTFRREVFQRLDAQRRRTVSFANHLSPLVRWITKLNRDRSHSFFNAAALTLEADLIPPGDYCFRIERWKFKGLSDRERLAYGVAALGDTKDLSPSESEQLVQELLRRGRDWVYVDCNLEKLEEVHAKLEEELGDLFGDATSDFHAENETMHGIKVQRVRNIFERRIAQDEQRLKTLHEGGRAASVIRATEGRLAKARELKKQKLDELESKAEMDMEQSPVAAGVFRVTGGDSGTKPE
jgi:superfamily II DNA or RNA helicase